MLKQVVSVFACLLMIGCTSTNPESGSQLFDTFSFFQTQCSKLKAGRYGLNKEMSFGEQKENITLDSLNWDSELAVFTAIDLRKPAYIRRFWIDSVMMRDEIIVHYKQKEKVTDIQDVWIYKQGSKVNKIKIVYGEQNQLYASNKELIYYTDSGFEISGSQSVKLSVPFLYKVKAVFKEPTANQ
jgi:hypothetical protein